jgi:hypothetical protein
MVDTFVTDDYSDELRTRNRSNSQIGVEQPMALENTEAILTAAHDEPLAAESPRGGLSSGPSAGEAIGQLASRRQCDRASMDGKAFSWAGRDGVGLGEKQKPGASMTRLGQFLGPEIPRGSHPKAEKNTRHCVFSSQTNKESNHGHHTRL